MASSNRFGSFIQYCEIVLLHGTASGAFAVWTQHLGAWADQLFTDFISPLIYAGWVMIWWVWFRLQRPAWLPPTVAGLTVVYIVAGAIGDDLFFAVFPHPVAVAFHTVALVLRLLLFSLLLWIVIQGIRWQGVEGWLVLPAVVLLGISQFAADLSGMHIRVFLVPIWGADRRRLHGVSAPDGRSGPAVAATAAHVIPHTEADGARCEAGAGDAAGDPAGGVYDDSWTGDRERVPARAGGRRSDQWHALPF